MVFEDSDFNIINKILIDKCCLNNMHNIVGALLNNDYNVLVSTDDDTGDYIVQCALKNSDTRPYWDKKLNSIADLNE